MPRQPVHQQDSFVLQGMEVSEEISEIISAVPSWILKRGATLIFFVLVSIILLSAFIHYPDVVKTPLKINSLNSPKGVISHQSGKLVRVLVKENEDVTDKQPLAYIESTGNHNDVLMLANNLQALNRQLNTGHKPDTQYLLQNVLNLGELQGNYESFYQEYLQFINSQQGGFYITQRTYLEKNLEEIRKLQQQINKQRQIQEKEYANAEEEYRVYQKLRTKSVISINEFRQQENKYLASKYPLQQSSTALLNNKTSYLAKQQEIASLNNTIREQEAKFRQALNSMINATNAWLMQYVIMAPLAGKISYVGILQENQNVTTNQELFIIDPGNTNFFGEVQIPQYNMGKVAVGQRTLIKLKGFPFEEYGIINGKVSYITNVALKDSVFIAKVEFGKFEQKNPDRRIVLKPGMIGDAEIITRESSLLQRLLRNMTKMLNSN